MSINTLIHHLEVFITKKDVSVQWAKDTESLIDTFEGHDEIFDELQDCLSLYRPEGGPHLYDEEAMGAKCKRVVSYLKTNFSNQIDS